MNSDDLRKLIQQKMAANPSLRSVMKRIQSGNATFRDTADYSRIYSELLGKCLSENVLDLTDREAAAADILRDSYDHTNSILSQVQTNIDKKNGINIRPQTADFPLERVLIFSHSLVDPTVEDSVIQRRAGSGSTNISMSHHDDYMETNARFRSKAGLKCYITRETDGKCCKWCTAIAGRYVYGEEPHDVYRRHDNCGCSVIYENGRQRQDVWSKRTWEKPKKIGYKKPTVISPEQARALEQGKLSQIRGLKFNSSSIDIPVENDIIESRNPATQQEIADFKASLLEMGFTDITGFENYTESNEHLLEIAEDFGRLKADFPDYFKGLKLDFGITDGMTNEVYAAYVHQTGTIHLNPVYYNNFKLFQEAYAEDIKNHYHPRGTTYRANVFHEFGHRFEAVKDLKPKQQVKRQFENSFSRYYTRKQADEWIKDGLCLYAAEGNFGEYISECFAEYYGSSSPRRICVDFIDSLETGV